MSTLADSKQQLPNTATPTVPSVTWDHIINNTKGLKERNLESRLQLFTFNTMEMCKWERLRELFVRLKHPSYIFGFFWKTIALVADHNTNAETLCQMMEDIVQWVGVRKSKPFWIMSIGLHHVRNTIRIAQHALPQCLKIVQTEPELCTDIQKWIAHEHTLPDTITYFTSRKGHPEDKKVVVFTTFNSTKCVRSAQGMVLTRSFFNNIKPQKSYSMPKLESLNEEEEEGCTTRQAKRHKQQQRCKTEPKENPNSKTKVSVAPRMLLIESPTQIHTAFNSLNMRTSPSLQPIYPKTCLVPPLTIEPSIITTTPAQPTSKVSIAEIQSRKRKLDHVHVGVACENSENFIFNNDRRCHNLPSPSRYSTALSTFIDSSKVWEVVNRGVVFGTTHETFFAFDTPESWSKVQPNEVFLCKSKFENDRWAFRFFVFIRLEYGDGRQPKFRVCMLTHAMSTYIWTAKRHQSLIQSIVERKNQTTLLDGLIAPIMPIDTFKALVSAMETHGQDKENQSGSTKCNSASSASSTTNRSIPSHTHDDTEAQIVNIMLELREKPIVKKTTG